MIILAHKRTATLKRLLASIEDASRKGFVNLVISCDGGSSNEVRKLAQGLKWEWGSYDFIQQEKPLGVKSHNLWALELASNLDRCLILEDDLLLAPHAMDYIREIDPQVIDERICGIALYRYSFIDHHHLPFVLIPDGSFVYYQQRPCSNGCYYRAEWAKDFLRYLRSKPNQSECQLPPQVQTWDSDKSWQKDYYCYLQSKDRYLLFPRYSLSTDFGKPGSNMKRAVDQYQHHSALFMGDEFGFRSMDESINVYDAHYELLAEKVKEICPELEMYDVCVDLHGGKDLKSCNSAYLLSTKKGKAEKAWARKLKPQILNLRYNISGDTIKLMKRENVESKINKPSKEDFYYYFPDTKIKDLIKMKAKELWSRFTS